MADPLTLTPDEQAALEKIAANFPGLVAAIETHVQAVITESLPKLQGLVTTEAGVDHALAAIVDRVIAQGAREHAPLDTADDLCGVMTWLVARHAAAQARDGMLSCLLRVKDN